jgi:hypothetical protein
MVSPAGQLYMYRKVGLLPCLLSHRDSTQYALEAGDHMGSTSGRQVELLVEGVELTAPWRGAVRLPPLREAPTTSITAYTDELEYGGLIEHVYN